MSVRKFLFESEGFFLPSFFPSFSEVGQGLVGASLREASPVKLEGHCVEM